MVGERIQRDRDREREREEIESERRRRRRRGVMVMERSDHISCLRSKIFPGDQHAYSPTRRPSLQMAQR